MPECPNNESDLLARVLAVASALPEAVGFELEAGSFVHCRI